MKKSIGIKITVLFLITVLSASSLLSFILYQQSNKMVTQNVANEAYRIAKDASKEIDITEFMKLKNIEDEKKDSYIQMRNKLEHLCSISGAKYIFTMTKLNDGKFMYVVDGSPLENMSHIGDTEESIAGYEKAWSGEPYISDKIQNIGEWGILVSSYYPLKDNGGNVVGIVGVEYDAEGAYLGLKKFKTTCILSFLVFAIII